MPTFLDTEFDPIQASGVVVDGYLLATGTALDPATGQRSSAVETITDEVAHCFAVIDDVLGQAGMSRADLVKTTCWITDESYRQEFIEAYRDQCAPGVFPARVTMVAGLPGGCRVTIEAVAAKAS